VTWKLPARPLTGASTAAVVSLEAFSSHARGFGEAGSIFVVMAGNPDGAYYYL
jgi:hypothetical protein